MLYTQPDIPKDKLFLPNQEYQRALLSLVKYCHDVVFEGPDGKFYLPSRRPGKTIVGPWFVGGAVKPFTDISSSLVETLKRETGLDFTPERFIHIGQNRYFFNGKEEGGVPHDALSEIYLIRLLKNEIELITLDPEEYTVGSLQAFGLDEVSAIENPFVRKIFLDLWEAYKNQTLRAP